MRNGDSSTEEVLLGEADDDAWTLLRLSSEKEQETLAGGGSLEASDSLKCMAEACYFIWPVSSRLLEDANRMQETSSVVTDSRGR